MSAGSPGAVRRRRLDIVAIILGVLVLVPCVVVARSGEVGSLETRVFEAINTLPNALSPSMRVAQLIGVIAVGPLFAVVGYALRRRRLAAAALIVTAGKLLAERGVWQIVQRSRPGTSIPGTIVRGDTPTTGVSFVSGHVVLVVGLAWIVAPYLDGGWRVAPWLVVAVVAFARIYLGAHAPLDVLGGVGLGLIIGGAANLIVGVPTRGDAAMAHGSAG